MSNRFVEPKYITGLIIILAGALLLLRNLDIIYFTIPSIIFSWQVIIIVIGTFLLINSQNKSVGLVLIVVGGLGLIPEYWPAVLILLGIFIIFRKSGFRFNSRKGDPIFESDPEHEVINEISLFGGGDRSFHGKKLKGGSVSAIFGGSKIDLSESELAEGDNIVDLFFMFGGSSFVVPSNWKVQIQTIPIFGGFSDKRVPSPDGKYIQDRTIVFKGLILFGGGEIKNYK